MNPQQAVDGLVSDMKRILMTMINETMDEIDKKEPTDDQKKIVNDFAGTLGQKILSMRITLEVPNGKSATTNRN